tara:strand:+ start:567 stop:1289 length:723 start_codon:yes stop_codon:yes gene_type:complete
MFEVDYSVDFVFNAYNEIETIENDLKSLINLAKEFEFVNKIIVVEDGSQDGTAELLVDLRNSYGFELLQSKNRRGYANALITGLSATSSEFIFFSDFGGKFDWSDINKLLKKLPNYDLIIGVRKGRTDPIYRRLLTILYSLYIKLFFQIHSKDPDSGFRVYRRNLVEKLLSEKIHNKHLLNSEFTIKSIGYGFMYTEVEVKYYTREGKSRGLPINIIPQVILTVISNSFKIKKQIKENYE